MLQDLGSVSAMRFEQAQPLPASNLILPSYASASFIDPFMSSRAIVDRAVCHSNGLHGHYASPHQQQYQLPSLDFAEWSYPAADSNMGTSAAAAAATAYNGEEVACDLSENPVSQQQPANFLYRGYAAQPSLSTRYLARRSGETSLAQPEREQRARIWDVQQGQELGPGWGLDDAIADIGGDEALAAKLVAELDHNWSADHIHYGSGAAESGSACVFAAVQHAAIPICLSADIRTPCIIHVIVCMSYQACLPAQ